MHSPMIEKSEDTKWVTRSDKSKERRYKGPKKQNKHNTTQKTKNLATRSSLKTG